jgi:hypothetical protein
MARAMPRKTTLGEEPVKVPIAFPSELYEWLRLRSFEHRVPMAELVREAVLQYRENSKGEGTSGKGEGTSGGWRSS